jgi:hypothetical protein
MVCEANFTRGGRENAVSLPTHDSIITILSYFSQEQQLSLCAQHVLAMNKAIGRDSGADKTQLYADFLDSTATTDAVCFVKDPLNDFASECSYPNPNFVYIHASASDIVAANLLGCSPADDFRYTTLKGLPPLNLGRLGYGDISSVNSTAVTLEDAAGDMTVAKAGMQCLKFCNDPKNFDSNVNEDGPRQARNAAVLLGGPTETTGFCEGNVPYCNALGLGQSSQSSPVNNCACFFRREISDVHPYGWNGNDPTANTNHCFVNPTTTMPKNARLLLNSDAARFPTTMKHVPPPAMPASSDSTQDVDILQPSQCTPAQDMLPNGDLCYQHSVNKPFNQENFVFAMTSPLEYAGAYVGRICATGPLQNSPCSNNADWMAVYNGDETFRHTLGPNDFPAKIAEHLQAYQQDGTWLCAKALPQ